MSSNIVKLADGVYIKNFSVKTKWIYADLEIDIPRHRYFGRWTCDDRQRWKCGNEDDTKIIVHLRKQKQKWDDEFWKSLEESIDKNEDIPDLDKIIKKMSKRPVEFAADKAEKKEVSRILNKSW